MQMVMDGDHVVLSASLRGEQMLSETPSPRERRRGGGGWRKGGSHVG